MVKSIKAIKCPQCGSTKATELKPDYYRCNSCSTEFFLDSDDININHNHNYNYPNQPTQTNNKKAGYVIAGFAILFVILPLLINLFFSSKKSNHNAYSSSALTAKDNRYRWNNYNDELFVDAQDNVYFAVAGTLYDEDADYKERDVKNTYLVLYDAMLKLLRRKP